MLPYSGIIYASRDDAAPDRSDIPLDIQQKIDRVIQRSVRYAFENPLASREFVAQYAQEMDINVRQQHIDLYVNHFTEALGEQGRAAVELLFQTSIDKKIIPHYTSKIFVNWFQSIFHLPIIKNKFYKVIKIKILRNKNLYYL